MSTHIDHASRFALAARQHSLILPRFLPTQQGLAQSPECAQVVESSRRTRETAANLMRGKTIGGMRLDAGNRPHADVYEDALGRAHVLEWAQTMAFRAGQSTARMDAFVPMANEGLTSTALEVYRMQHAALSAWSERILPIDRTFVDPAAERYDWYEMDNVGVARAANTYSTMDIPMVAGPEAGLNVGVVLPALVGMETNFMDDRRQALARSNRKPNFEIARMKAEACEEALAEFANFLWLYGDAGQGIYGFHNHPSIASIFIAVPWASATPAQIVADLANIANAIPNNTRGQLGDYKKIRILLPPGPAQYAMTAINSAAGTTSIMKYWTQTMETTGFKPDQIEIVQDFAAANSQIYQGGPYGLTRDRGAVIYNAGDRWDPRFLLPQDIEMPAPPRQNGLSETTFFHMRVAGMLVADARRMLYIEGLTA